MKYLILALIVIISALSGWGLAYYRHRDRGAEAKTAENAEAKRIATLIASADSAGIRDEMKKQEEDVIVRDAKWIHRVSEAVAATAISRKVICLCCGWRTAHFYRNGLQVVSVATIHGNQLRIYWEGGGGDFPVAESSWKAVEAALAIPKEALVPTTMSVTPAADALVAADQ
ncbi:MAG: hypothetical protein WC485_05045 [Opitutaceae bacterium]